ncbi:MAG: hypothetical protein PQJ46_09590 [Spirochaetales bacterium]|nr:hypothetical protein [Spirochaetales bacterium]
MNNSLPDFSNAADSIIKKLPFPVRWFYAGSDEIFLNESWKANKITSALKENNSPPEGLKVNRQSIECACGRNLILDTIAADFDALELREELNKLLSEKLIADSEIERLKMIEPITGLFNHTYLMSKIKEEDFRCRNFGQTSFLIIISLKTISIKDIISGAEMLKSVVRKSDILGYTVTREFCIMVSNTDLEFIQVFIEKIKSFSEMEISISTAELPCEDYEKFFGSALR